MGLTVFIAVDDLRPEINSFGRRKLITPDIDRLASWGIRFDRAYCQFPQCMPSRCSVMAGKRPTSWCDRVDQLCDATEPTLPQHFKDNGYETVSIGKVYHRNFDDPGAWTRLYDFTFHETDDTGVDGYCAGYQLESNREKLRGFGEKIAAGDRDAAALPSMFEVADAPDSRYPDHKVAVAASDEIHRHASCNADLFLAVGFYRPHLPWAVPRTYWDLYDRQSVDLADNPFLPENAVGSSDLCDFLHYGDARIQATYRDIGTYAEQSFPVLDESKQRECIHGYWASVSFVDAQIGIILDALEETGLRDTATVVLWGDNGWHLGEHALWAKTTHFEESTRVPLVVSAPELTNPDATGEVAHGLVELVDLFPTLCDAARIPPPAHLEGMSLLPQLADHRRSGKPYVHALNLNGETVRSERYRLTRYANDPHVADAWYVDRTNQFELFDLSSDPSENRNIAGDPAYETVVSELSGQLLSSGQ